jgi:RNA polymerase sigma-70 factor (ECF subfamily)
MGGMRGDTTRECATGAAGTVAAVLGRPPVARIGRVHVTLDADAISQLYRDHAHEIVGFCMRRTLDPEVSVDIVAETFAVAFRDRAQFRGHTREEAVGWLYAIARHQLSGYWRRGRVERRALKRLGVERPAMTHEDVERIEELAGTAELRDRVASEMGALRDEHREAVRLRVVEECSYPEVASALGITEENARARVSRALRALSSRLVPETEREG